MSTAQASSSDFDFWEFVNCGRCQLPFSLGTTVPFWLTECGHVVCNNHLNVDQSCNQCGAQGVQLVPLQHELDHPMSEWFRSVPISLDNIAQAAKFQQETLASQIRHYRTRLQKQRVLILRLEHEVAEVKKMNETLDNENYQLRQLCQSTQNPSPGFSINLQQPSDTVNSNGKRPMGNGNSRPQTSSSPLSILTPIGPDRLTLPPGQAVPNLSSNRREEQNRSPEHVRHDARPPNQRPAGIPAEQYSYVPPSTPRFHPPHLSHTQAAPRLLQRTRPNQEQHHPTQAPQAPTPHGQRTLAPSSRFKPAKMPSASSNTPSYFGPNSQTHPHHHSGQQQGGMGPPPTPLHIRQKQSTNVVNRASLTSTSTSETFQVHPANTPQTNRFVLPGQPANTRAPSRMAPFNVPGGTQRTPFVPGGFT